MPDYQTVTVWHLRDLCASKRRIIKCDDVKVIQLPHYSGLAIEDILEFAQQHNNGEVMNSLPENMKETLKMPRSYLANVVYTIVGDAFQDWANARIDERNSKVIQDKDMVIQMDPQVAAIFRASSSVSGKCTLVQ